MFDKRFEQEYIGFVSSELDAELLIVERYLAEKQSTPHRAPRE